MSTLEPQATIRPLTPVHDRVSRPLISSKKLGKKSILIRAQGLNINQSRKARSYAIWNWNTNIRPREYMYKFVTISGVNEIYNFIGRETGEANIPQDRIKVFYKGHVHSCDDFIEAFPRRTESYLFLHKNSPENIIE
ncbi:MAG: hypothetical protein DHS20C02_14670 [Micavibrio sp.]|nr:MAG: hypothetical protein DHS20C02_14670 [Micavibrio sp.]